MLLILFYFSFSQWTSMGPRFRMYNALINCTVHKPNTTKSDWVQLIDSNVYIDYCLDSDGKTNIGIIRERCTVGNLNFYDVWPFEYFVLGCEPNNTQTQIRLMNSVISFLTIPNSGPKVKTMPRYTTKFDQMFYVEEFGRWQYS